MLFSFQTLYFLTPNLAICAPHAYQMPNLSFQTTKPLEPLTMTNKCLLQAYRVLHHVPTHHPLWVQGFSGRIASTSWSSTTSFLWLALSLLSKAGTRWFLWSPQWRVVAWLDYTEWCVSLSVFVSTFSLTLLWQWHTWSPVCSYPHTATLLCDIHCKPVAIRNTEVRFLW